MHDVGDGALLARTGSATAASSQEQIEDLGRHGRPIVERLARRATVARLAARARDALERGGDELAEERRRAASAAT